WETRRRGEKNRFRLAFSPRLRVAASPRSLLTFTLFLKKLDTSGAFNYYESRFVGKRSALKDGRQARIALLVYAIQLTKSAHNSRALVRLTHTVITRHLRIPLLAVMKAKAEVSSCLEWERIPVRIKQIPNTRTTIRLHNTIRHAATARLTSHSRPRRKSRSATRAHAPSPRVNR